MKSKIIAIIPARSGSKGLPNKNVLMLIDKPLMAYTIEAAIESNAFDKVIVTTDSQYYGCIAEKYGAEVLMRPEEFATDNASSYDVISHALNSYAEYGDFALLQPTSPFRNAQHIIEAVSQYYAQEYECIVSVTQSDKPSSIIKPLDSSLTLRYFDLDYSNYNRNHSIEYHPNGALFIASKQHYLKKKHFFGKDSLAYIMNKECSVDIDDKMDFELAIVIQQKINKTKVLNEAICRRINEKERQMKHKKDITFIGHSLFDYWGIENLNTKSINNLGIAGINSYQYNQLIINKGLISTFGDIVFIFSGTNDIVLDNWKKTDTLSLNKTLCEYIKSKNPHAEIYFLSVPPVFGRLDRSNRIIDELNDYLKEKMDFASFVCLDSVLKDEYGNLHHSFTYDGLHFNDAGYDALEKHLKGIIL
ncbi:cytidylyltransferase domain-containing protein [Atlantibacter hermannii]|uniref:cytidylyltransferase domain-containing protein n=1 Tax=Atlantibacter hermannii TaxID=565 RepID=UPI0028A2890B|nr:GDSL-type esterase/lipase family protein [Atlantibacter hermannii]